MENWTQPRAALFTIVQNLKELKYPSVDEWTNGGLAMQWNTIQKLKGANW